MKTSFESERLFYREILASDDIGMFELDSDPEVQRFVGGKPLTSIDESREIIKYIQQQYIDNGIGRWAVILKETGEFIGWAGLKLMRNVNGHAQFYELGYRLIRKYWGNGYATEAAKAFIGFGFNELKLSVICAQTSSENKKSQNTLIKAGFTYINTFDYDNGFDFWYEIKNPHPDKTSH